MRGKDLYWTELVLSKLGWRKERAIYSVSDKTMDRYTVSFHEGGRDPWAKSGLRSFEATTA